MRNAARMIGLGADRTATAILSWANNPGGASVYFLAVEAPGDVYSAATDSFVSILKSFRVAQDSSSKVSSGSSDTFSSGGLEFTDWTDPHESAFSVSVPQGWQAIGGAYRLSAEDLRYGVFMGSPEGQVRATIGDAMVGAFTQPTPTLTASGLREGSYQILSDGTRVEVLRYLSGQQFARSYVETLVSRQCSNPQISSSSAREDLAATFGQSAANEGFTDALLTAGDVSFSCTLDGKPVKGAYVAATIRMSPSVSPMWFVYRLYGYIASPGREQEGEKAIAQIQRSLKFSSQWDALQKQATSGPMPQDAPQGTDDPQQIRDRAQQAIAEDQQKTSEAIAKSFEQRQKEAAEIDRKRENSVLGRIGIADRDTGTQFKIADFRDFHYLSNDGYIESKNSSDASGSKLREMIALP
jgi:hypothetical protein